MAEKKSTPGAVGPERTVTRIIDSTAADGGKPRPSGSAETTARAKAHVADRGQTDEAIRDLQASYQDLFDSAYAVILMVDADGNILDINRRGEELSGFSRQELLQSNVLRDLIAPEDRETMIGVLANLIAGENQAYEVRWRAKDGREIAFEGRSSPHFSRDGEFVSTQCILHDLSERREAEQALRLAQFSVDHASDAVFWLDPDARFIYANIAACKRLGYSREELLSMTVHDIDPNFPAEDWPAHWEELKRRGSITLLSRHRAKDGRVFPVELTVNYLEFAGKQYNCAFARDIAERKWAEQELQKAYEELEARVQQRTAELARSNADLQQFAYSASHDLQEPLRMMGSYLQALEEDARDTLSENARNFIQLSLGAAQRMQQLIDGLLSYAYVGTRAEEFEMVDSNEIVDQAIEDLGEMIRQDGAEVTRENLPTMTADPMLVGQLFQNLIGNAIKFHGPQRPRVHVSARTSGDELVFSVRDNGIGIEPKHLWRVFAVFERLHPADTYSGTGIGLAICKRVVQRHKGRIWCDSEPGKGTTFHFSIPQQRRDLS